MKSMLIGLVKAYRLIISPLIGPRCRFFPSCSEYAINALSEHRSWHALWLTGRRVSRCHPWGASGVDEVPSGLSCPCRRGALRSGLFHKVSTRSSSCPPSV